MKHKRMVVVALLLAVLMATGILVGCSGSGKQEGTPDSQSAQTGTSQNADAAGRNYLPAADGFAGGSGTAEDPYRIETAAQLAYLSEVCTRDSKDRQQYDDRCYILTADIELNPSETYQSWSETPPAYEWKPIGCDSGFRGSFDGNGHTVSGLYFRSEQYEDHYQLGLFGKLQVAKISNLKVERSYLRADHAIDGAGVIAAQSSGSSIENCTCGALIEIAESTKGGGIVGYASADSTIRNCTFTGTMRVGNGCKAGGIAGDAADTSLIGLENRGSIQGEGDSIGGIVGYCMPRTTSTIENCKNYGEIHMDIARQMGGVIGQLVITDESDFSESETRWYPVQAVVRNCENFGSVSAKQTDYPVGGIVGFVFNTTVGTDNGEHSVELSDCVNHGSVSSEQNSAAGVIGELYCNCAWKVENCVNEGAISAGEGAAGIVAIVSASEKENTIVACKNTGDLESADSKAGGIVWKTFLWSLHVSLERSGDVHIRECVNSGRIHGSGSALSGIGGILGCTESNTATVYIEKCLNEGELAADNSCRMGGILGNTYFDNMVGFNEASAVVSQCVNKGRLVQGDAGVAFDTALHGRSDLSGVDVGQYTGGDSAMLVLGGSSVGGVIGYCKCAIVKDSANLGEIAVDSNSTVAFSETDLIAASVSEENSRVVFCGGVAGLYFFLESSGTVENSGILRCVYPDNMPLGVYAPFGQAGTAGIEDIRPLSADELESKSADLLK